MPIELLRDLHARGDRVVVEVEEDAPGVELQVVLAEGADDAELGAVGELVLVERLRAPEAGMRADDAGKVGRARRRALQEDVDAIVGAEESEAQTGMRSMSRSRMAW